MFAKRKAGETLKDDDANIHISHTSVVVAVGISGHGGDGPVSARFPGGYSVVGRGAGQDQSHPAVVRWPTDWSGISRRLVDCPANASARLSGYGFATLTR
jgi:hypothetical protein